MRVKPSLDIAYHNKYVSAYLLSSNRSFNNGFTGST